MSEAILNVKKTQVEEISKKMKGAVSFVVTENKGLSVAQITELRNKLYEANCEMKIIKNNISRRAAKDNGFDMDSELVGPNSITFSKDDSIAAAKILYDFAKDNDKLVLKVGVIDGNFVNHDELMKYATLPSRETLLTMLASALIGTVKNLSISLDLLAKQKEENAGSAEAEVAAE